jgi:predicted nuclease with RNAse H fold/dephospho-CoA kinase
VLFLDVETTGLSHHYDEITVIGWSIGGRSSTIIKGQRHDRLLDDAKKAVALVTFNGRRFDQRFLRQEFPDVMLPEHHIDLMYLCRRVGLTGGQKAIEKELGLNLRGEISDIDGLAAVLLWHRYLRGDRQALETLVRYNRADIAAMGKILDHVLAELCVEPDLFADQVEFHSWAAPNGWFNVPTFELASPRLTLGPSFGQLFADGAASRVRMVGIDLTGSEARDSGWCLLEGNKATTTLLATDDQILAHTIEARPDLVSIDSPLCLPAGRTRADDTDPERERFGIMRECERELKRRGVNVYPCLLPSMQKLTARGIRLAEALRRQGLPVVESYPGAAQDIMRIPRKGAGLEWLRLGLSDFGIIGDMAAASHDELDAITSALVGSFHWVGMSEALGGPEEAPLIVPMLAGNSRPIIIGISGALAAGKTTVARAFVRHGFTYTRFSLVIDDELHAQGKPLDRAHRQALGGEINRTGRQTWLAERTLARAGNASFIVVDGLRFPEDHAVLAQHGGGNYMHIFVDADEHLRRARYLARISEGDFDMATSADVEGQVEAMRALAHRVFRNTGSQTDIESWVDELVIQIRKEKICPSPS